MSTVVVKSWRCSEGAQVPNHLPGSLVVANVVGKRVEIVVSL